MNRPEAHDLLQKWVNARQQSTDLCRCYQSTFHSAAVSDAAVDALKVAWHAAAKVERELQAQVVAVMCGEPEATQ